MFAETGANPLAKNEFLSFLHLVFPRLYQREKNSKKYAHHYNRCKIRRGIQIRAQNRVTMQKKPENAENCRNIIKLLVEKNDMKKYLVHQ